MAFRASASLLIDSDSMFPEERLTGLTNGQVVFERYSLKKLVGRGGMGVVWLAQDNELEKDIALKFLSEQFLFDSMAISDLKKETRRGMELGHPNVVRIFGFFNNKQYAAVAMEYVEGNSLCELRSTRKHQVFEAEEIGGWVQQLCSALHYAHFEAEIVHRDLKPANLLIDRKGRLKVADFGISGSLNDTRTRLTRGADTAGTLSYMGPQQLMGQKACISHDVYALGATLYDLLTGKPPFYSGDVSLQVRELVPPTIAKRREELSVQSPVKVPEAWEETIAACLLKDASERPKTMEEVAERLGLSLGGTNASWVTPGQTEGLSASEPTIGDQNEVPGEPLKIDFEKDVTTPTVSDMVTSRLTTLIQGTEGSPYRLLGFVALFAVAAAAIGAFATLKFSDTSQPIAEAGEVAEKLEDVSVNKVVESPNTGKGIGEAPPLGARETKSRPSPIHADGPPSSMGRIRERMGPLEGERFVRKVDILRANNPVTKTPVEEHPFVLEDIGLSMVWIPSGVGNIGSPGFEPSRRDDEDPMTHVLVESFWIDQYELSEADFKNFLIGAIVESPEGSLPKVNVSWNEAIAFCEALTAREREAGRLPDGYHYSLPTESQWIHAAKGGMKGLYGSTKPSQVTDYGISLQSGLDTRQSRGTLASTNWGLYDIFGNVAEWCWDGYGPLPGGRLKVTYSGIDDADVRVIKGGSFRQEKLDMRVASRDFESKSFKSEWVGFRLALVPEKR